MQDIPYENEQSARQRMTKFDAKSILELLQLDTEDYWKVHRQIERSAPTAELVAALEETDSTEVRRALCHIIGRRCAPEAVPALINCLHDPDPIVCTEAAEALGNVGDARAGSALFERYSEPGGCSRNLLAFALGSVGYRPAIPVLIEDLTDPKLRGSAAIALASLGAVESQSALHSAFQQETGESTHRLIERALSALSFTAEILDAKEIRDSMPAIAGALEDPDPLLNLATVWALQTVVSEEAQALLRDRLAHGTVSCPLMHRIRDALEINRTEVTG